MSLLVDVARILSRRRAGTNAPAPPPRRPRAPRRRDEVVVVGDPPPPSPSAPAPPMSSAPISPPVGLDEEGLHVFHERVGIGLELGMTEEAAAAIAGEEAWLETAGVKAPRLREVTAAAIRSFGGPWAVEVRPGRKEATP